MEGNRKIENRDCGIDIRIKFEI